MVCRAENVLVKLVLDRNTAVGEKNKQTKNLCQVHVEMAKISKIT